jgi:hypothetical protein
VILSNPAASSPDATKIAKAEGAHFAAIIAAVNRTLADEAVIRPNIAIYKGGVNLTGKLSLQKETGWFRPLVQDLLGQDVAVIVNRISLIAALGRAVQDLTGVPADWVFQQNLYITRGREEAFLPHYDPHIVVAAQLYGRKEWVFYDKAVSNPLIIDETVSTAVSKSHNDLGIKERFTVEAGDVFVIPRGQYHSARAVDGPSVHLAIGCAGIRPVDYIWELATRATGEDTLRADFDPETARQSAARFLDSAKLEPLALPRNPIADYVVPKGPARLSFAEVLDAL